MRVVKLALWALLTLFVLVVAVSLIGQNTELVEVSLFNSTTPSYPKWAVLLSCVFIGAALSSLFFVIELIVLETKNIRLRRINQKLERALSAMKGQESVSTSTKSALPEDV